MIVLEKWTTGIRHAVSDDAVRAGTIDYLNETARKWVAFVALGNGIVHKLSSVGYDLKPEKVEFSLKLMQRIHGEFGNSGYCWVLVWRGSHEFAAIEKDRDGDFQVEVECKEPWPRVQKAGIEGFIQDCVTAHRKKLMIESEVGIKRDQQIAKAIRDPGPTWRN